MGLETAFYALQGTDAHIFSGRATITERRHLEPRWRQATFIAGLCSELHRPLSHIIVTNEAGDEWSPYLGPLADWLSARHVKRYFLKWRPNAHESRALGLFALPHVVLPEQLQDLASNSTQIVPHLLATITGMPIYHDHNMLETLVRRALALVIDRFLLASAERYGKPQLGSHLERYLVDALRRLAASNPGWTPNADKSRVWHGSDGMFLVWPSAADDIRKLLEADQLPGIPKSPETVLEVLLSAGVLAAQDGVTTTWLIHPPGSKSAIEAVKLSKPTILYAESDKVPHALPNPLLTPPPASSATPAAPPARAASMHGSPSASSKRPTSPPAPSPAPTQDALPPQQLLLLDPAQAKQADGKPSEPPAEAADAKDSPDPQFQEPPKPTLLAPLRLPVTVRDALLDIVSSLTGDESGWAARPTDDGLFIPLSALAARQVAPPAAIRAMTETGMLTEGVPITRSFQGKEVSGVLLAVQHVAGLPATVSKAGR